MHLRILFFLFLSFAVFQGMAQSASDTTPYKIETKELYFTNKDTTIEIYISYPILTGKNEKVNDKINTFLYSEFVPEESEIKKVLGDYETDEDEDTTDEDEWHGIEKTSFGIEHATNNYLSISKNWGGDYTGAAHPSWWSAYYHFDVRSGEQLSFNDFFDDGIYSVIERSIFKMFPSFSQELRDSFDVKKISFDFYFTKDIYDREIFLTIYFASYSEIRGLMTSVGYTGLEIPIPKSEAKPYIRDKWKKDLLQ